VLDDIDRWFEEKVFEPLRADDPARAIQLMMQNVESYFRSGQRVCLVGAFALSEVRDRFATSIHDYFRRWIDSLCSALVRSGLESSAAARRAEDAVLAIQGALVLTRALSDEAIFSRAMERISADLGTLEQAGQTERPGRPLDPLGPEAPDPHSLN
jgi:TetR/AcrR family transcriptional regulator, lmrAB and yxaGH operons repressor